MRLALLALCLAGCGYDVARPVRLDDLPATRDPRLWPFSSSSLWNRPVGAGAVYQPAQLTIGQRLLVEESFFVQTTASDPERDVFAPGDAGPCSGTRKVGTIRLPDAFVLTAAQNGRSGNPTSVLMPDGRTLFDFSGVSRCRASDPLFAFPFGMSDLFTDGQNGGHGGSGLSALGGSLRAGELIGPAPIRHAIKLGVWGNRHLFFDPARPESCYRWPAVRCDAGAGDAAPNGYHGTNPQLVQGTLLAIPPQVTEHQLALTTWPGKKLFWTLQNFGAYVVVNTGADVTSLVMDTQVPGEFTRAYGHPPEAPVGEAGADWFADVARLIAALAIVENNGPDRIGGGGLPRVGPAPEIAP